MPSDTTLTVKTISLFCVFEFFVLQYVSVACVCMCVAFLCVLTVGALPQTGLAPLNDLRSSLLHSATQPLAYSRNGGTGGSKAWRWPVDCVSSPPLWPCPYRSRPITSLTLSFPLFTRRTLRQRPSPLSSSATSTEEYTRLQFATLLSSSYSICHAVDSGITDFWRSWVDPCTLSFDPSAFRFPLVLRCRIRILLH
jgi:hypothetical protein